MLKTFALIILIANDSHTSGTSVLDGFSSMELCKKAGETIVSKMTDTSEGVKVYHAPVSFECVELEK